MTKRLLTTISAITTLTLTGGLVWSMAGAPLSTREANWAAQGYQTPTATPGPSPTPSQTPTKTPIPFLLTPRPTSTALTPRPATPTPQTVAATPGPCTVALSERSATCKTAHRQPVTWTLRLTDTVADQRVVTSSLFDFTSRAVFTQDLLGGAVITVAPRWQAARAITVITLTGAISGKITGTLLAGFAPPNAPVTLIWHRWTTATRSHAAAFYATVANASGVWTRTVPVVLAHPRDYWQVRHTTAGVTHVAGMLTHRLIFPIIYKQ